MSLPEPPSKVQKTQPTAEIPIDLIAETENETFKTPLKNEKHQ